LQPTPPDAARESDAGSESDFGRAAEEKAKQGKWVVHSCGPDATRVIARHADASAVQPSGGWVVSENVIASRRRSNPSLSTACA
jgi:hypothetical protein